MRFKLNYNVLIRVRFFFLFLNKSVHDVLIADNDRDFVLLKFQHVTTELQDLLQEGDVT